MPTVKLPNGTKRTFPYNAVGKAQAHAFMKMSKGKMIKTGSFVKDFRDLMSKSISP